MQPTEYEPQEEQLQSSYKKLPTRLLLIVVFLMFTGFILVQWLTNPPRTSDESVTVVIEPGLSAAEIADELAAVNLVRSSTLLYSIFVLLHDPSSIQAGTYVFEQPQSVFWVANRIANDNPEVETVPLTFPEGFTVREYAKIAAGQLENFNSIEFELIASTSEGFLFPDTYFVPPLYTAEELYNLLRNAYTEKTAIFANELNDNKLTEQGIVTLASILEREANTPESMRLVSGILDTRLVIGMALQVDASMEYVLEKPLKELTPEDLEIDSPYNTYMYRGLPPTPIGNPGLTAIKAALNPTASDYLYYITDETGDFYYAETFEQHKQNIARYLR